MSVFQKLLKKLLRKRVKTPYQSETSKVRHLVIDYCHGTGCDIGFGGDKIKADSIGIDLPKPYAFTGEDKVDIGCDVINKDIPVENDTFDYVYSSHLIEDFDDTVNGLIKFIRILKSNGRLILVFPDQKVYERHCIATNQVLNTHHKHGEMGLSFMKDQLKKIDNIEVEYLLESNCAIDYNVIIVAKIIKNGVN